MTALISDADVARLNNHGLRAVLNALLTAEADLHLVPLTDLDLTLRDTDPDAGIDGRIKWPRETRHDVIPTGLIVLQYKSGKLRRGEIAREFAKRGVQDALKKKGHYIFFISHPYPPPSRDRHRNNLRELCRRRRINPSRCTILYGDQIARWISRFPSVVIRPELEKGYPAFDTIEAWQHQRNLANPFKVDPQRQSIIDDVRAFARSTSDDNIMRVEGLAGVGKTRTVLEALRVPGLAERSLYCVRVDDPSARQLLSFLQSSRTASALIVFDECDRESQETLRPYAELSGGRLRLVCIGPAEKIRPTPVASGAVLQLDPLQDEQMRAIVRDVQPTAPREIEDAVVRLSGGMPKLAVFIINTMSARQIRLPELVEIPDVRTFLKRFVEEETFKTLQGLSLLAKVGWQDELRIEAETITLKALHLAFDQVQDAVKKLKDQGVVLSRGKYLYVSPDLLAISAAAELWDVRGAELITIIADLPGPGPRRQMLRRLAVMAEFPVIKQAVEQLLSREGLYKSIKDLEQAFLAEVFGYLAAALPIEAQRCLDRVLAKTSDEELRSFRIGRREIVWALESLLRWPKTSMAAARLLRRLALNENETVANNAAGIFQQFFSAFLSSSPVPLGERLQLISELIATNEPASRLLAVKGAGAALAFHESRMGGELDPLSQRKYPSEWKPETWGELWDARRIAIDQLSLISKGNDEAAAQATEALYHATFTLTRSGQAKDAVSVLEHHAPRSDKDKRQVLDSAQRILKEAAQALDDREKGVLKQIIEGAFGTTYFDRIRRWIGRRANTDYDLDGGTGYNRADAEVVLLAEEGFRNGITDAETTWLASPEAENVWLFGKRLGELDAETKFLDRILSATPADVNCMLFASYLVGLSISTGSTRVNEILDGLETTSPVVAFGATWRVGPSEAGARRVIRLMESGQLDPSWYRVLEYGSWVESIPEGLTTRIIELLLRHENPQVSRAAVAILDYITRKDTAALTRMQDIILRAVKSAPTTQDTYADWQWSELATRVASTFSVEIARIVLERFEKDSGPHISSDPIIQTLAAATRTNPEGVWLLVGDFLLRGDLSSYRLMLSLQKWYGDLIPGALLTSWAREHQPKGPLIAAELLVVTAPLTENARALISAFPGNPQIFGVFGANLQTGSFWGPISANLENQLAVVRQWEADSDPRIKDWAHDLADWLEKRIKEQKLIEEGEEI